MRPVERRLVRWSSWATGLTGLAYLWMKHFMEPSEPWAAVNHPLQPWTLKAHILVAPILVFALGTIAVGHVWSHWRSRLPAGRRSGILLASVVVPMVVSGYLIQAITHPAALSVTAWIHIVAGVVFLVALGAHLVVFRRGRPTGRGSRDEQAHRADGPGRSDTGPAVSGESAGGSSPLRAGGPPRGARLSGSRSRPPGSERQARDRRSGTAPGPRATPASGPPAAG